MTTRQAHRAAGFAPHRPRTLRPWPALYPTDGSPPPKPLTLGRLSEGQPQPTHTSSLWALPQRPPGLAEPSLPFFTEADPVQRAEDNERAGMTLLVLVLCATLAVALLGFGLRVLI